MISAAQTTSTVLMVPPVHFAFNEQTGEDNGFQQHLALNGEEIRRLAMTEFDTMVQKLRHLGVNVLTLPVPANGPKTPDAVFPNNWFSTHDDAELILYPMAVENRRQEVQPELLQDCLGDAGFAHARLWDLRQHLPKGQYLEGTGAMVLDRVNHIAYAALSQRCDIQALQRFCEHRKMQAVTFDTRLRSGQSVYHTNVMMALGTRFAVLCQEVIVPEQRHRVCQTLAATHEIIDISEDQLHAFCGNVLEVQSQQGKSLIVMSASAFDAFTEGQKTRLCQFGELVPLAIPTIETIGGGSVRCMLAEIFLPTAG